MRTRLIQTIVDRINVDPWKQMYRGKPTGTQVTGWPERLRHYSWATKAEPDLCNHLIWLHKTAEEAASSPIGDPRRKNVAAKILEWGGVTRGNLGKLSQVLDDVIASAHAGARINDAPMNSGWTKIAAVFAYRKANAAPQVIWDSRVSLSVCTRLGKAAGMIGRAAAQLQGDFDNRLGWVGGRGGTRPQLQAAARHWFPSRYGKWEAHFEGGLIVKTMADILNAEPTRYGVPVDALSEQELATLRDTGITPPKKWTPWLVASVLFMDGQ